MKIECCIIDYTTGKACQCKNNVVFFGRCWEHLPDYYKEVLKLQKLGNVIYRGDKVLVEIAEAE